MCGVDDLLPLAAAAESNLELEQENASNPLAAVNNTDLKWQGFSSDAGRRNAYFIDGAYMIKPTIKLKYELHYNENDFTGSSQSGLEKLVIKPLFFFGAKPINETWAVKFAVGFDWILDLGDTDKAIGAGADQIAPLGGAGFTHIPSGLVLIPLAQHFMSYNGSTDISTTAVRLIALKPFGPKYWAKGDFKIPYDWENDHWLSTAEIQVGYNIDEGKAVYVDALAGLGRDRPYDGGIGIGLRFKY